MIDCYCGHDEDDHEADGRGACLVCDCEYFDEDLDADDGA